MKVGFKKARVAVARKLAVHPDEANACSIVDVPRCERDREFRRHRRDFMVRAYRLKPGELFYELVSLRHARRVGVAGHERAPDRRAPIQPSLLRAGFIGKDSFASQGRPSPVSNNRSLRYTSAP